MFVLKDVSPKFIPAVLKTGRKANFEGAILILTRGSSSSQGLSSSHQRELMESWSDLDDMTHNDLLVLTVGVSKKHSGIPASNIQSHVVVGDEVFVASPSSETLSLFSNNFNSLLKFADPVPQVDSDSYRVIFDSHGINDIRRALGLEERQLPVLLIASYRHGPEYVIELGSEEKQLSPVRFISELVKNLDDAPYKYQSLTEETKKLSKRRSRLLPQIQEKQNSLRKLDKPADKSAMKGELESLIYHLNQTLVDAPDELKAMGEKIIGFLSGKDEEVELIKDYESSLITYARSQNGSAVASRLPKKLLGAIDRRLRNEPLQTIDKTQISDVDRNNKRKQLELDISKIEEQMTTLRTEEESLYNKRAALNIETAFTSAIETTLEQSRLKLKPQDNLGKVQLIHSSRKVYGVEGLASLLQVKIAIGDFDVFLCHNNKDKPRVKEIGEKLKEHGILPWLDEWELRPGMPWQALLEKQIEQIKAAAVFVGKDGIGPWEHMELAAFLRQFVKRSVPVIPIILADASKEPKLPIFLEGMTWVDFRQQEPDPMERLIWGITGERPHLITHTPY